MRSDVEHYIYYMVGGKHFIILVLNVHDVILISDFKELVKENKSEVSSLT
jgi:hypothetical protein